MYKTSEDLDTIVKASLESEMGFVLLQSDSTGRSIFDLLAEKSSYEERQVMFGANTDVIYHLFPLFYQKSHQNDCDYAKSRAVAIQNIFMRYTECGYNKHRAKNPYKCKPFMNYLETIEWSKADYMMLRVE